MITKTRTTACDLTKPGDNIALQVTGRVEKPLMIDMADIRNMETEEFQDLFIVCGSGTPKDCIKRCRGVLMEKIIQKADVIQEEHNDTKKMTIRPLLKH